MSRTQHSKVPQFISNHLTTSLSDGSCSSRVTQYIQSNSNYSIKSLVQKIQQLTLIFIKSEDQNMLLRIQQAQLRKSLTSTKQQIVRQILVLKDSKNNCHFSQESEQSINNQSLQKDQQDESAIQTKYKNQNLKQTMRCKNSRKWSNLNSLQEVPQQIKKVYRSYINSPNKQTNSYIESKYNFNLNNNELKIKIKGLGQYQNQISNDSSVYYSPRKAGSISKTMRNKDQDKFNKLIDKTQRILNKNNNTSHVHSSTQIIIPNSIQQIWDKKDVNQENKIVKCGSRKVIKRNLRKSYLN